MPKNLFITISPPDRSHLYAKLGYLNPLRCVYLDDWNLINSYFKKYHIKQYSFYPELDKTGRLHWHGRCCLTRSQEASFYMSIKPKLQRYIGFVKSEETVTFKENLRTLMYCRKDFGNTRHILGCDSDLTMESISPIYNRLPVKRIRICRQQGPEKNMLDYFFH